MKSRSILAMLAAVALAVVLVPATANAQDTTDVYVVHGLNLSEQTAQGDGGTNVTVCADDTELIGDFTFGTITDAVALTSGTAVNIEVFLGAGVACTDGGAVIDQDVTPSGAAVALVATSAGGTLALTPFELDAACTDAGEGRLTALHASGDTPAVDVLVNGETVDALTFGESLDANLPAATYSVQVDVSGTAVVGPADIPVAAQANTLVFVVGNIPIQGGTNPETPVVPLIGDFTLAECEQPAVPTTSTPTSPTVVPPTPGAAANTAAPISFTG